MRATLTTGGITVGTAAGQLWLTLAGCLLAVTLTMTLAVTFTMGAATGAASKLGGLLTRTTRRDRTLQR